VTQPGGVGRHGQHREDSGNDESHGAPLGLGSEPSLQDWD
jgi:hypothetical protein